MKHLTLKFTIKKELINELNEFFEVWGVWLVGLFLALLSVYYFNFYLDNHLGVAYNDARSHLDIGRRVVEGLKPGIAQIGSVWLPLNHILMIPLIWNDWAWHTGFAGAFWSMLSFIATGILVYKFLQVIKVGSVGRIIAVLVFALNINILYLQSTAMTELLLLATMTAGVYYLIVWATSRKIMDLVTSAFWIMMSTMVRYDGWFLLLTASFLIFLYEIKTMGYKKTEGVLVLFLTLGAFGIALWFLWNLLIFKDPFYFMFGPFSAHAQQEQLSIAGNLQTKGDLWLSIKIYFLALFYNSYTFPFLLAMLGALSLFMDKITKPAVKIMSLSLFAPLLFNIIALVLGFSVLFISGISGNSWFNVRYGVMMAPAIAIFIGVLIDKAKTFKTTIISILLLITFFAFTNSDAVTIDDAVVGASQKNVSIVAGWLKQNAMYQKGYILISAASHDAIIFSSELPMRKFIHEGTGLYWDSAIDQPDKWARWIIMRTYDNNDLVWKNINTTPGFENYKQVGHFPFADIYELKPEFVGDLITDPVFPNQK